MPPLAEVTLELPAVAVGSFEAEDGSVATFVANVTADVQGVTVRVPEASEVAVFSSDRSVGSDGSVRLKASDGASGRQAEPLSLSLDPFDVRVIVVRRNPRP